MREYAANYLGAAELLGTRTAEMHLALATPTDDPAFAREPFSASELKSDSSRIESQLSTALDALHRGTPRLTKIDSRSAELVLSRREELLTRATAITKASAENFGQRIRIHGDYHLGQVLRTQEDFVILDFEGEPARPLAERRAKQSSLKDVAGMLRSFGYAAYGALYAFSQDESVVRKGLEPWALAWQNAVSTAFLRSYRGLIEAKQPDLIPRRSEAQLLLRAYLIEKALYELQYELNNRPGWVSIPLAGIVGILMEPL
jgi:maltose alpha-D-glucosyltransferase/alpha-amylase